MSRLLRLLSLYKPFYGWMALGVLASLATLLANVTLMATSGWFITSMAIAGVAGVSMNYFTPAAIIRGAAMLRTGGRYAERLISHEATLRLLAILRGWFYAKLEPLAPAALQGRHSGDLLSRLRADIDTLDNFYLRLLVPAATATLGTLILTLYLATIDGRYALVLLAMLILAGVGLPWLVLRLGYTPGQQKQAELTRQRGLVVDGVQGMGELLLYGAAETQVERLRQSSEKLILAQARQARVQGLAQVGLLLCANLTLWLLLWLAIPAVEQGQLAKADLAMLALFALAAFETVMPLPTAFQAYGETRAATERLFEIVDAEPTVAEPESASPVIERHDIRIRDLSFTYPGGQAAALRDLNLEIPAGGRITLVGPSGAGKSTLVQLLLRFHEPDQGQIWLGGQPLSAFHGEDVRAKIAVVEQRTHLFTGTVRDNLLLAKPDASPTELEQACRIARIHDFIAGLAEGYDTWLGEAGATLSGGQARRIALARAILKDAPILILDEPTEGLDATSASQVLAAIDEFAGDKTVLLITHRRIEGGKFGSRVTLG